MSKKYLSTSVFVFIMLLAGSLFGKTEIKGLTIEKFIKSAKKDRTLKNQKELTNYLKNAPGSTPYLDKMEFRTKTEEFDIEKQKYSLRFYPKGFNETKYTREVADLSKTSNITNEMRFFNDAFIRRYKLVLSYLETKELISLKKRLFIVCEDRVNVLRKKSAGSLSFDISDLISAEELLTDLRLERVELENRLTDLEHQIRVASDFHGKIDFDLAALIGVDEIAKLIKDLEKESLVSNIKLEDQKNKVALANSKYLLEKSKNRDYLSFFEVSYDTDDYDDAKKACSVEFAFKLPFIHSDRDDINRKKVSYMKEKLDYEEDKRALTEKRLSLLRSAERLIKQYSLLTKERENSKAEASLKTYLKMEGMDPLNILKIKESILQSKIQVVKTGFNIRTKFLNLMELSGKLTAKPFINYITHSAADVRKG